MSDVITPTIHSISRHEGVAGQYALLVTLTYPDSEPTVVNFVGSTYGGPVFATNVDGMSWKVDREVTERCGGTLSEDWVRAYFAD